MTTKCQREVVVEYERVQLIRRKATATLSQCERCGCETDHAGVASLASLFGISTQELVARLMPADCHYNADGEVCLTSLLASLNTRPSGPQLQIRGGINESF